MPLVTDPLLRVRYAPGRTLAPWLSSFDAYQGGECPTPDVEPRPTRALRPRRTLGAFVDGRTHARLAMAAACLGVELRPLVAPATDDSAADDPAGDAQAAACATAAPCDVVTATAEHVPARALAALEPVTVARPAPALLAVAQDRVQEKAWLDARAGHAAPWHLADSPFALADAVRALCADVGLRASVGARHPGAWCVVKPRHRRAGGPLPVLIAAPTEAAAAWDEMGRLPCVVERALAIDTELTVLVARTARGHTAVYPVAQTVREGTRRRWSVLPAPVPTPVARKAQAIGSFYANRLGAEGLLAVELFVLADGRMVVNELVPCPHPALDPAELACETDQFAQLVRAVCGLPLGGTALVTGAAASVPLPAATRPAATAAALADLIPGARLTWYDEAGAVATGTDPDAGHVTATGRTPDDAVERALAAAQWVHAAARHAVRRVAQP